MQIKGSVALIIGAAHGIGKATVDKLLQLGAKVAFGDNEVEAAHITLKEFQAAHGKDRVFFQKCDITQKEDIRALVDATIKKWGQIDIFSPIAGIAHETEWELSIAVNLNGGIESVKEVMKHMAKDEGGKGGVIIMMSSIHAWWIYPFSPVYRSTKIALLSYAEAMGSAESFAHHGIRFNTICPSGIRTRNADWLLEDQSVRWLHADEAREFVKRELPPGLAEPSSVAKALVHMVEDETMNGQALFIERVDGNDMIKKVKMSVSTDEVVEIIKS